MKIIGFDYDGTIINIEPQKAKAFSQIIKEKWNIVDTTAADYWIATGGTSRRYKFDYCYEKYFGKKLSDSDYQKIERSFSMILKTKFYPQVKVLDGAITLLKFVQKHFDYVFVSSGVTHDEINFLVELNKITSYFDGIFGTDEKYLTKADHFQKIVAETKPLLKIFIGDGIEDMRVATKFGFTSIGIPTNHAKNELKNAGADYVIKLSDCKSLIERFL